MKRLYRDLFEQRELLATARDSYKLVWGFRRLRWSVDGQNADHPLFTVPVEVDLDESSNALRVRPASSVELEALYLAGLTLDNRAGFNAIGAKGITKKTLTLHADRGTSMTSKPVSQLQVVSNSLTDSVPAIQARWVSPFQNSADGA